MILRDFFSAIWVFCNNKEMNLLIDNEVIYKHIETGEDRKYWGISEGDKEIDWYFIFVMNTSASIKKIVSKT